MNVFVLNNLDSTGSQDHAKITPAASYDVEENFLSSIMDGQDKVCIWSVFKVGSAECREMFQEQVNSCVSHIREAPVLK